MINVTLFLGMFGLIFGCIRKLIHDKMYLMKSVYSDINLTLILVASNTFFCQYLKPCLDTFRQFD